MKFHKRVKVLKDFADHKRDKQTNNGSDATENSPRRRGINVPVLSTCSVNHLTVEVYEQGAALAKGGSKKVWPLRRACKMRLPQWWQLRFTPA